ncbi:MAG TPA: peptide-binding protein [Planctomycetaceae bacterium]|nr:peptide-binding protein [Planctomycetaceae bacterium]
MPNFRSFVRPLVCLTAATWLLAFTVEDNECPFATKKAHAANAQKKQSSDQKQAAGPFVAPPLAELDAKAEWIDQPVKDTLQLMREKQAGEKPLASLKQALALKNKSKQDNERIASALGRVATDDSEVDYEATINRHMLRDVKSTNPIMGSSVEEFDVGGLTGAGLFAFDWDMNRMASSDTVVSWQTSRDRMYDKVVMRDDLTWSDGQPITAHDVEFSYHTIMNDKVPVPAVRSGVDKLLGVHAYDDRTLVFFHKEALATNIWNVDLPIIPRHIYEKSLNDDFTLQNSPYHVKYESNPVCGGAYTISKRVRRQEIVLTRRESWYMHNGKQVRDKPYFKEIRFRVIEDPNIALLAVKNGEIDEMLLTAEQWVTQTNDDDFYRLNTKASGLEWTYFFFSWNLHTPFFSDVRVRKAMSYAFDYKEMLDKLFYGLYEQSNGMFHRGSWMAPKKQPPLYKQDLDKAEQLLDDAGWEDHDGDGIRDKKIGKNLVKFEFSIICPTVPERVKLCTLLKENLAQIGVICNVRQLEPTVLQDMMLNHKFEAAFGGWGTGADPDTSDNIWATGEGRNFGFYSNPKVDELYKQGRLEFDRKKRGEIYGKIHSLIFEDQPYTFLYFRNSFYAFSKKLRGYNFSPRGPFHYGPGFSSIYKAKN